MKPVFLTHNNIFQGDFSVVTRKTGEESNDGYHYHDFYDAHVFFCDESDDRVIGTATINGKEFELRNGDAVLIRMFDPHQFYLSKTVIYRHYCVSINSPLMLYICSEKVNLVSIFSEENPKYPHVHLDQNFQQQFRSIHVQFEKGLSALSHGKNLIELSGLISLLAVLYNAFYAEIELTTTETYHADTMNKLVHYIEDHLAEDLSLETLSKVTNFSSYYLCHLFKKYTSTTLNKYIMAKRIDTAKKMLTDSSLSLQSISMKLGFSNYNHFFRCFRQFEGVSPSDYRTSLLD